MTKKQLERRQFLINRLASLGFSEAEAMQLRRIEMTLHRWAEAECGDSNDRFSRALVRDEETGKPYWSVQWHNENKERRTPCADRERGALKRLAKLVSSKPGLVYYHQGDPRGCALYVGRESDLAGGSLDSCYTRLVAVCD